MSLNIDYKRINAICLLDKMGLKIGVSQIEKAISLLQLANKSKKKESPVEVVDRE